MNISKALLRLSALMGLVIGISLRLAACYSWGMKKAAKRTRKNMKPKPVVKGVKKEGYCWRAVGA